MADASELVRGFVPESELERAVTEAPELLAGLAWGKPRRGHPEGSVGAHVADLLTALDRGGYPGETRSLLRFVALVHDSFKYRVHEWLPKTGENHHATRARRFAEAFTDDERLLATIEHHDGPYALWREMRRRGELDEARFVQTMEAVPDGELFLRFIELDGSTEGKRPEPIRWFRDELLRRGILERSSVRHPP
ncbi:MAG TPA: HD domain-containing protein [Thermoleophilaceae bacterium]